MAIEIIRADGTRDEESFVVIKTLDAAGETVESQAIQAMKFHLSVEAGLCLVEVDTDKG